MGNQESTANVISDVVNKSVTNVLASSSSNCAQTNNLVQEQVFKDLQADEGCSLSFSNISQTSVQSPNFTCSSDSKNDTALASQFKTELLQQANATVSNSTIGNAVANSLNKNNTINDIANNINISTISSCVQDNFLKQSQGFNTIKASCPAYCRNPQLCIGLDPKICDMSKCSINYSDISQSATQSAVASCLSSNANYQKILSETSNKIAQEAKTTNTGVSIPDIIKSGGNALSSVIGATWLPFIIIGIVIIIVIAIGSYFLMSPSQGSNLQMLQNAYNPPLQNQGIFNPAFINQLPKYIPGYKS